MAQITNLGKSMMRSPQMKVKLTDGQLNRAAITGGRKVVTTLDIKRTYEKLRKRSYRDRYQWDIWQHRAYVQGVRDALNEVSK
jgi:hypothetical protein